MRRFIKDPYYLWRLLSFVLVFVMAQWPLSSGYFVRPFYAFIVVCWWLWQRPDYLKWYVIMFLGFVVDYLVGVVPGMHALALLAVGFVNKKTPSIINSL